MICEKLILHIYYERKLLQEIYKTLKLRRILIMLEKYVISKIKYQIVRKLRTLETLERDI